MRHHELPDPDDLPDDADMLNLDNATPKQHHLRLSLDAYMGLAEIADDPAIFRFMQDHEPDSFAFTNTRKRPGFTTRGKRAIIDEITKDSDG